MLGASEKYKERAMAIWRGSHASVHLHGRNKRAEPFVVYTTDSFAGAGGARAFRDAHAVKQHFSFNTDIAGTTYGRVALGLPSDNPTL